MASKTQSVTYVSKFRKFRFGDHQFINGRLTIDDPKEIARLDAHIAKGGRVSFAREPSAEQVAKAESTTSNKDSYDWSQHTVAELKSHAANADVKYSSNTTKPELIEAIEKSGYRPD